MGESAERDEREATGSGQPLSGRETLRNAATLGLAVGAPLTLLSGLFIGVTLIGGPPALLWAVFLTSASTTVLSLLIYAYLTANGER